ncbi:MAG: hypothetical protein KDC95_05150 [Planctomycetes bacterium]|nr:hypothetical protein [Planctomycetota bacterium]
MSGACTVRFEIPASSFRDVYEGLRDILASHRFALRQDRLLERTFLLRGVRGNRLVAFLASLMPALESSGLLSRVECYVRAKIVPEDPRRVRVYLRVAPLGELSDGREDLWSQGFGEHIGDSWASRRWFDRIVGEVLGRRLLGSTEMSAVSS